jgi:hypothetical protein
MTTKYIARLEGKIVGKRTSESRTYTHAVVVQPSESEARAACYGYTATKDDRANFDYYTNVATLGMKHSHYYEGSDIVERAKEQVEGGFEAYVARLKARAIERFEERVTKGEYQPHAVTWCGRLDLAHKEAARRKAYHPKIWIVPAEVVQK